MVILISDRPLPHPECMQVDGPHILEKLIVTLKYPANRKINGCSLPRAFSPETRVFTRVFTRVITRAELQR